MLQREDSLRMCFDDSHRDGFDSRARNVFCFVWIVEMVLKLYCLKLSYFKDPWNYLEPLAAVEWTREWIDRSESDCLPRDGFVRWECTVPVSIPSP